MVNAAIIRTTPYQVSIPKDGGKLSSLKIVLAADLHLGYSVGKTQMRQMVEKINRESPDLVVIAGDVFDNDYEAMDDPEALISILQGIQSKYGVYACYGNHDVSEKILAGFTFDRAGEKKESDPRMDSFLERAGIRLLKEEWELIDGSFYLYGRPDQERPGRGVEVRKTPAELTAGLDAEKTRAPRAAGAGRRRGRSGPLRSHTQWAGIPWKPAYQAVLGKCLRIHAKGWYAQYCHLRRRSVRPQYAGGHSAGNLHRERELFRKPSPEIISRPNVWYQNCTDGA